MERGVEARHLRQIGPACQQHPDRRQVVGLVQRRQRNESLESGQHIGIDPHRSREVRSAVHHTMPDRLEFHPRRLTPEELGKIVDSAVVSQRDAVAPALFRRDDAARGARDEVRGRVDALDLSAQLRVQPAVPVLVRAET